MRYGRAISSTDILNLSEMEALMKLKISHVQVNSSRFGEVEYVMDRPVQDMHDMITTIMQHYPNLSSMVITLVREKNDV